MRNGGSAGRSFGVNHLIANGQAAKAKRTAMQNHGQPLTLSERADELEEQMMNELNERIATKSVLFNMGDGKVEIECGAALMAKHPGKLFLMGADPRLPKMPDKPTLVDFFKLRFASTAPSAAERDPCAEGRARRKDHPGLPAARHRRGELHPLRSRLLGRAADRALCGRGGELGDSRSPGAALLSR